MDRVLWSTEPKIDSWKPIRLVYASSSNAMTTGIVLRVTAIYRAIIQEELVKKEDSEFDWRRAQRQVVVVLEAELRVGSWYCDMKPEEMQKAFVKSKSRVSKRSFASAKRPRPLF